MNFDSYTKNGEYPMDVWNIYKNIWILCVDQDFIWVDPIETLKQIAKFSAGATHLVHISWNFDRIEKGNGDAVVEWRKGINRVRGRLLQWIEENICWINGMVRFDSG